MDRLDLGVSVVDSEYDRIRGDRVEQAVFVSVHP